ERVALQDTERVAVQDTERVALHRGATTTVVGRPFQGRHADITLLRSAKDRSAVVKKNAGASLVDLGDGVLALEFHSKMNAIGGDTMQMIRAGVKEAAANFAALVVGNDAPNFSVGANLMLLLLEAQEGNWDEIDLGLRTFQEATQALRFADTPVVVAPAGMALGGGCEIVLHGDRVQAAAESYIGLVEVGAGLMLGVHLAWRAGRISDHDAVVGRALANVIAGGALPHQTTVSEQYLLDLEREAFLKLCGERKTLERIQHTLKTGKPLRN